MLSYSVSSALDAMKRALETSITNYFFKKAKNAEDDSNRQRINYDCGHKHVKHSDKMEKDTMEILTYYMCY
ncbi:UNVERIFIED_CONTAM: hypothetical protein FKN15_044951 [Acipenser sinensis]